MEYYSSDETRRLYGFKKGAYGSAIYYERRDKEDIPPEYGKLNGIRYGN